MNLRRLRIALQILAAILVVGAAVIFFSGGLSFRSETKTFNDGYVIKNTVVLSHTAIFPAVIGVVMFGVSLFIPSKRA
jgi:hypothetical protein